MDDREAQIRAGAGTPISHAGAHPPSIWAAGAPEIRYVKSEDGYVAYQVFGHGAFDIMFIGNWASNIEVMWEHPSMARYMKHLGHFARVICFDKRGAGLSDPVPLGALPTLEHWMDDARIVLDAVGSEETALIGDAEGGPMAMMFAATYPQRTRALVLVNTFAKMLRAADYPIGMPEEAGERLLQIWERAWGTGIVLELSAPSVADDPEMQRWAGRYMRLSAPPAACTRMYRWVLQVDVRSVLQSIQAPTLILHRVDNRHYRVAMGRYLAEHIPGAKYVEPPGADWYPPFVNAQPVLDEIAEFLTGSSCASAGPHPGHRVVTDIVASTIWPPGSVISAGSTPQPRTTGWCGRISTVTGAKRSRRRGTASSQPSTVRLAPYGARRKSPRRRNRWESRSGLACTAARSRFRTGRLRGSRSTSQRASWHSPTRVRCWCRGL